MIFVFGSNEAGRHGRGAALEARKNHGAVLGQGYGIQGNSFAIPTKNKNLQVLALPTIRGYVLEFLRFARKRPDLTFGVTRIGCGLSGYSEAEIAPMFNNHPENVTFLPDNEGRTLR